ncbi:hypothetical protein F2Q68_00044599 [Brassica cretica]|uniref:DUF223 domain-containing protein n=1 Tax=Brassica cretica TaxID=69181 RepID=A0A8S9LLA8_BRACR|nr:hypothetical protein F2Q68_00044599 [Brassica cretica]
MSIVARNVQHYVLVNLLEVSSETQKIRVKIINKWTLNKSRGGNSIELVLVDASVTLKCTLWGEHAKRTFSHTTKKMDAVVVCVMCFMFVKSYKGEISISNAFSITKILFDPATEHVDNFRNMADFTRNILNELGNKGDELAKYVRDWDEERGDKLVKYVTACDEEMLELAKYVSLRRRPRACDEERLELRTAPEKLKMDRGHSIVIAWYARLPWLESLY